jgi:hypothetical protein
MILKLIIFIVAIGAIYRFFGGKIPFIDKEEKATRDKDEVEKDFGGQIEGTSKCASCGIYITEDDALIYHRKAYCSNSCVEDSKKLK